MSETNTGAMPGLLDTEITVTIRKEEYIFKIPGIRYELDVGYRSAQLRRQSDPDGIGDLSAVDMGATMTAWCGAVLELYLLRSSATWPFSRNDAGKPVVRFDNFPANKFLTMREVGEAFGGPWHDFETMGLPTTTPLAIKMWQVARIQGHKNPFGKPITEYTIPELDFVLEMEAKDNPSTLEFARAGQLMTNVAEVMAAWASVLQGKALQDYMTDKWAPKATQAFHVKTGSGMQPGVTRGGKAVNDNA